MVAAVVLLAIGGLVLWRREQRQATTTGDEASPADAETVAEPLTDEDRVRQLLDANGGQMRQADIVDSTGWSKSKTSRVLSSMAEDGTVEKLEIGRENVIRLQSED